MGNGPSPPASKPRQAAHLLRLPERVPGTRLPRVELVDMIDERRARRGVHLLSQRLEQEMHRLLSRKGPRGQGAEGSSAERNAHASSSPHSTPRPLAPSAPSPGGRIMLLLNRRGYANYIACPDPHCGWMMNCDFCDAMMVYHKQADLPTGGLLRCHHCDAEQLLPPTCPECGNRTTVFGLGTQRVEEELARKFPSIRAVRMDSDTMRNGRDYQKTLDRFRAGEIEVLLGTQMIAKGLDFPKVELVGVISGDTSLHMPDFRAAERTFQLIAQVAGRAGRSDNPGLVLVQTFNPDDPVIQLAAEHDYEAFAARELEIRREVNLPPVGRMARIVVRDEDHVACTRRARTLADALTRANGQCGDPVRLRGPMPCPIARIAGCHRQQIELMADPPRAASDIQKLLTALRNARLLISDAQTAVDVDPVALL